MRVVHPVREGATFPSAEGIPGAQVRNLTRIGSFWARVSGCEQRTRLSRDFVPQRFCHVGMESVRV